MTSLHRNRLRSALYLSIADLFLGAAAVIIVLVVFATRSDVARYPRNVDFVVACAPGTDGAWVVRSNQAGSEQTQSVKDWVRGVEPSGLIARVGVLTPPNALGCFAEVERAVLDHNRRLTTRSGKGGVISTIFLPENSDG